ncbi:MAG: MFS transporter [Acidobacteria bacterium]|nr:MFS transporter [Acidobacteriota bacterium]
MSETKATPATLDVGRIIDDSGRNRVSVTVILLCGLIMLMDGFDYRIITVAAPLIMKEWSVSDGAFIYVFSAAFAGYFIGAIAFGALSDRIGRKKTLIITACIFSVGTLFVYFTNSLQSLIAVRIFTGIGIGGAVPCAITLTSEYSPLKQRGKYVSIMYSGFLIGVVLGGFLAGGILERFGWRPLFLVGFFAPVAAIVLVGLKLPESIRWLSARGQTAGQRALIARLLPQIAPDVKFDESTRFVFTAAKHKGSIRNLFAGRLSWVTPVVWAYYLVSSLAVFFISSWTPRLLIIKGYTASPAAYITGSIDIMVTIGCMFSGFYFDKAGFRKGAIPYLIAVVCVLFTGGLESMGFVLLLMTGSFFINSAHMAVTILAPIIYPSECRNLGGGAAIAAGRIGAIIGPIIGGILLDTRLPLETLLGVVAIPLVMSAVLCYISGREYDFHFAPLYAGKKN